MSYVVDITNEPRRRFDTIPEAIEYAAGKHQIGGRAREAAAHQLRNGKRATVSYGFNSTELVPVAPLAITRAECRIASDALGYRCSERELAVSRARREMFDAPEGAEKSRATERYLALAEELDELHRVRHLLLSAAY